MNYHFFKFKTIILFITLVLSAFNTYAQTIKETKIENLLVLEINSTINPATKNYLKYNINKHKDADAYLIKMNTPGGLLSTTKNIVKTISNSKKPFFIWIGGSGSSATSAGAIIASSSHALYMAEGTNIGAATPISTSGDLKAESDTRSKAINDIRSLVRSQSQMHQRPAAPFEEMITTAKSYTATEASSAGIINGIVNSPSDLLSHINGKQIITIAGTSKIEISENIKLTSASMDLGQRLLNFLSSPDLAYILMMIGAALLYLELQSPGGFIAGSTGILCLLIAGIGFQVLPLNAGALGLIALSFILFSMEIYITSFGILALAGLASLITGSMFLFRTEDSYLAISSSIIFSTIGAIIIFIIVVFSIFMRSQKRIGKLKFNSPVQSSGVVIEIINESEYMIKSHGEYWKSISKEKLEIGDKVKILSKEDGLILNIEKEEI